MATQPDPDESGGTTTAPGDEPDFGPSGYLPPKASARARKIVLRAPLGLQWVIGALVAGVLVVVAGAVFLTSAGPPDAPYVATVLIDDVEAAAPLPDIDSLLVTAGGPAVAFADLESLGLTWCARSGRVEGGVDGRASSWHAGTGRGFGVRSLDRHPVVVHDGTAYVDPTRLVAGPRPSDQAETPACR